MASIGVKLGIDGEAEYRKQLNNIIQSTKTLDKQMEELQSSFNDETDSMEQNAKETELLQKKAELLTEEVEKMQEMVDAAAEKFGESSTECQKWEQALATAKTELNNTNSEIEAHEAAAEEANSALGMLTSEISNQTAELDDLRDQYINAVLEFGETSDEAEELAGQIQTLNGELESNRQSLSDAQGAADALTQNLNETGEAAEKAGDDFTVGMVGQFIPGFDTIAAAATGAGIADLIGGMIDAAVDLGKKIWDTAIEWEESMGSMEVATGLTGDKLKELHDTATEVYLSFSDANASIKDFSEIAGMLYTRLGLTEENAATLIDAFAQYAKVTGTDAVQAVNDVVDIMKQYGVVSEDNNQNVETAIGILDMLIQAQSDADVSVSELASNVAKQAGAFQSLGMDYEDVIGLMTAYRDAGGDVNDISMAIFNVVKNLSGETDDLKGAWNEAVNILSNSKDTFTTLSTEIGNTGKTIEDVFGARKAQQMISTFSNGSVDIEAFTSSIQNSSGVLQQYYNDNITTEDVINSAWKNMATNGLTYEATIGGVLKNAGTIFDLFAETSKKDMDSVSQAGASAMDSLSTNAANMNTSVSGSSGQMTQKLGSDIGYLRNLFSDPLHLNIVAPTISYSKTGSGENTAYIPNVSYATYAAAYDRAMILNSPTIFGAMGNQLLVGGDGVGAEVVVGENHLLQMMTSAVERANYYSGTNEITINVYGSEGQDVNELAEIINEKLQAELDRSINAYG